MFDFRNLIFGIFSFIRYMGLVSRALLRGEGKVAVPAGRKWSEKPGLSIMYQIETRPGWKWDRDYDAFNKSMHDAEGNFVFNGPFCNMQEWVQLSQDIGVDYHVFEVKWHDGICYFNTSSTPCKSDKDYTREFSDLSRAADIPFMFYYSSVFDHNPKFDAIQPNRQSTPSLIGNRVEYRKYIKKHYAELVDQYKPDGMWFDWFWSDGSTGETANWFRKNHPETVVTFNLSNLFPKSFNMISVTSSEAHCYDGPWVTMREEASLKVPVLTSAVKWSNAFRMIFDHPWEVCSPAGKWWQDQSLRDDPQELLRSTAMVLACGGKLCIGATSQMDGHIFPDQLRQLNMLGAWYKPRKDFFVNAAPLHYRGFHPAGVSVKGGDFNVVASAYADGKLLHLVNRDSQQQALSIKLSGKSWQGINSVTLMPQNVSLAIVRNGNTCTIELSADQVDSIDTLLYIKNR